MNERTEWGRMYYERANFLSINKLSIIVIKSYKNTIGFEILKKKHNVCTSERKNYYDPSETSEISTCI